MHVLCVLDHPDPASFSRATADRFMAGAQAAGHTTELADLHGEGFDPRWTMEDITPPEGADAPVDVLAEQARIERADAIAMVFPLFWWGMPSVMKGWLDRVFTWGWAYDQLDDREGSLLRPRTGVMLVPAGARSDEMEVTGLTAALELCWNKETLGFFGLHPRAIHILNGSTGSDPRRKGLLHRAEEIGRTLPKPLAPRQAADQRAS